MRLRQPGFSLVEAMVVLSIAAILMAMAAPSFGNWLAGVRIRSAAESMVAGLQYARSEATTRNTRVRFQLTTSLDASCALSTTSTNWVVDVVDPDPNADSVEGQCNSAPSDTTAPSILQVRAGTETSGTTQVSSSASQLIFNGLGQQAPVPPATTTSTVTINVTPGAAGTCAAAGGKITCLRVLVTPGGQIRMCNPNIAAGDPQAC